MKKTILIGLTAAMTLSILASCGTKEKEAPAKKEDKVAVLNAEKSDEKKLNSKEIYDYSNKAEGQKDKKDPLLVIEKAKDPAAEAKKEGVYVDGEKEKILDDVREERDRKQNEQASKDLATKTSGKISFSDLEIEISDKAEEIMAKKEEDEKKSQSYSSEELKPVIEKAEKDYMMKISEDSAGRILYTSEKDNISLDEALRAYL